MKKISIVLLWLLLAKFSFAQELVKYEHLPEDLKPFIYAKQSDVKWFKDAKFGVFMHWGPYSLAKVPASWGRFGDRPGAGKKAKNGVPKEEYDNLYKSFNPKEFDADKWIKMVKDAGAKYFIFTTKHHDGFCMFDAKNTDYKFTNTPFKRDIAKELADACHKYGVKLFWYYSQPDWHHPDCLTENNVKYRAYMFEHLKQLLSDYGKVDGLFFDGLGTKYYHWDTPKMLKMIRTLQPGIIVNRRWGAGMPGFPISGDYDNPEQEFGAFEVDRPWEMCCTISEAWSWTGGERFKTYRTNQRILIRAVCSGGNLALNTGPSPEGFINPPEEQIYSQIGDWMNKYGESIYHTKGGPYKPGAWGGATCRGNTVYLHILTDFGKNGSQEITLPTLPAKIKSASLLTGGEIELDNSKNVLSIRFKGVQNKLDHIVKLELDTNAEAINPIETVCSNSEIMNIRGIASSSVSLNKSPDALFGKGKSVFAEGKKHKIWWSPENKDKSPWLTAEFERAEDLDYLMLAEQIRNCSVRQFVIEYLTNGKWKTLYEGEQIGMDFSLKFSEIKTKSIRMKILKTNKGRVPSIGVFRVFRKQK
ncbi:alpha-L-fucosidase [Marinifilum fragile]|uniref:alpha-L-fucosidase n=1 Tax=Marinifilum fragile TaxID=570161 RepID=UPI002AA8B927|nr:alpha-L-fucosidase [Marinifilum fragile]